MADEAITQTDIVKKPHVFERGSYRETLYDPSKNHYPKFLYHRDYVHERVAGKLYPETASAIQVENRAEEEALGDDWSETPPYQTAPDADELQQRRLASAAKASDWKSKIGAPSAEIGDAHVEFIQAHGRTDIDTVAKAYNLLAGFTEYEMASFLADFNKWGSKKAKKKKGE